MFFLPHGISSDIIVSENVSPLSPLHLVVDQFRVPADLQDVAPRVAVGVEQVEGQPLDEGQHSQHDGKEHHGQPGGPEIFTKMKEKSKKCKVRQKL